MEVTSTTVPGRGTLYSCRTRAGGRIGILAVRGGKRVLIGYGGEDVPAHEIDLDAAEADQLADLLYAGDVRDRVAALERRMAELAGGAS